MSTRPLRVAVVAFDDMCGQDWFTSRSAGELAGAADVPGRWGDWPAVVEGAACR